MATPERQLKNSRLQLRLSERQRELIDQAAQASEKDVSGFVLEAALTSAHQVVMDQSAFRLTPERWDDFVAILDRPVVASGDKARLEKLLREPSAFDR